LPASTYEGLSFDIKPTRRDSWFDKKEKPLNDGAYTILFEVDHDNNNKTEWVKTFFVKKVGKKITMVWLDETKDYCTKMIAEPNKIPCKEL